jgi:hypothetical protein
MAPTLLLQDYLHQVSIASSTVKIVCLCVCVRARACVYVRVCEREIERESMCVCISYVGPIDEYKTLLKSRIPAKQVSKMSYVTMGADAIMRGHDI